MTNLWCPMIPFPRLLCRFYEIKGKLQLMLPVTRVWIISIWFTNKLLQTILFILLVRKYVWLYEKKFLIALERIYPFKVKIFNCQKCSTDEPNKDIVFLYNYFTVEKRKGWTGLGCTTTDRFVVMKLLEEMSVLTHIYLTFKNISNICICTVDQETL